MEQLFRAWNTRDFTGNVLSLDLNGESLRRRVWNRRDLVERMYFKPFYNESREYNIVSLNELVNL